MARGCLCANPLVSLYTTIYRSRQMADTSRYTPIVHRASYHLPVGMDQSVWTGGQQNRGGYQWPLHSADFHLWSVVLDQYRLLLRAASSECLPDRHTYPGTFSFGPPVSGTSYCFADRCTRTLGEQCTHDL